MECLKPSGSTHVCATSSGITLPQLTTITLARYWLVGSVSESMTAQCATRSATAVVTRPTFTNYRVATAVVAGGTSTIAAPVDDITKNETTTITFSGISEGATAQIGLVAEGLPLKATIASCTTNGNGTQIRNIVWNEAWAQP